MDSAGDIPCGMGCPIRRSRAQSLLAAPPSFSQRATSFIASWRQGIHQMPLLSSTPTSDNRTLAPHATGDRAGTPPASARRLRRGEKRRKPRSGGKSSDYHKAWLTASSRRTRRSAKHTHAKDAFARRQKEEGQRRRLAGARRTNDACQDHVRHARATGTSSPPHDVQGTCPPPPPTRWRAGQGRSSLRRAWWAWADLNGRPHAYQACALTS
jgi:hypothetical protein